MPQYRRIAALLNERIRSGQIGEGERLPSERQLAEDMAVSRMTARKAVYELVSKGVVEARGGSGHYVKKPQIQQHLTSLTSFTEEMAQQGRVSSSQVIEAETLIAPEEIRLALKLDEAALVHRLLRLRMADASPVALETTYLNAAMMPGLFDSHDFGHASLYRQIQESYGIVPTRAEQILTARPADRGAAQYLAIKPGEPLFHIQRLTRDAADQPFEFVRSLYRADLFVVRAELNITPGKSA